jgi:replicative DNA helicase
MNADTLIRIPHNAEVERNLLGVLVNEPERIAEAAVCLDTQDFYVALNRKIYSAILELDAAGKPVEFLTIHELLSHDRELKDAGGVAFLAKIGDGVHSLAPLAEYCRIVKDAAGQRRVLALCQNTTQRIAEGGRHAEVLEAAAADFEAIRDDNRSLERGPVHISAVTKEIGPVLERAANGGGGMIGTPTGYPDIDRFTAGWQSGDLNILGARPSVGKTALAIEFALRQLRTGNPVAFFSLEMSRESILQRMVCREAGVDSQRLRCGRLHPEDLKKILAAVARVDRMPLWIDDSAGLRASELRWRLRSLTKRHGIKFAVVDYMQLLRSPGNSRFEVVTNCSIELKSAAKELGQMNGGTLLALAQFNRDGADQRSDKEKNKNTVFRPRLENLRESGQIEQDGDVIFLLSDAEPMQNGQVQPCTKILEIAKQRNGPCGDIRMTFLPAVGGFEQAAFGEGESRNQMWQARSERD